MTASLSAYWTDLVLLYTAFALAAGSPGPSNMTIMATAMNAGRTHGLALAAGVTAGSLTWGILSIAGIGALIAAHAGALYAIKLLGGAYLLFLAWRSARSALDSRPPESSAGAPASEGIARVVMRGYLMHLTNPKAILGWTAIIAIGLPAQAPRIVVAAILLGCFLISLSLNCSYALAFSTAPMVAAYRRARRWIEGVLAGFLAFVGLKLLTTQL